MSIVVWIFSWPSLSWTSLIVAPASKSSEQCVCLNPWGVIRLKSGYLLQTRFSKLLTCTILLGLPDSFLNNKPFVLYLCQSFKISIVFGSSDIVRWPFFVFGVWNMILLFSPFASVWSVSYTHLVWDLYLDNLCLLFQGWQTSWNPDCYGSR